MSFFKVVEQADTFANQDGGNCNVHFFNQIFIQKLLKHIGTTKKVNPLFTGSFFSHFVCFAYAGGNKPKIGILRQFVRNFMR